MGPGRAPERTGTVEVAAIVGSLRRDSFNRALLQAAVELQPPGMRIVEVPIRGVPLFDQDVEREGDPPAVVALKAALDAADAVLIFTPEYNQSLPGVLKNAIDWASRANAGKRVLAGKPVAILGAAAGRFGTARAQLQLRQLLPHLDMRLLPKPEVYVANAADLIDDHGVLTDGRTREQIRTLLDALLDWTKLLTARGT